MSAQKNFFTVCAIGPIRLLALSSYRSLTNQILIFGILNLNFPSECQQQASSQVAPSVLLCDHNTHSRLLKTLVTMGILTDTFYYRKNNIKKRLTKLLVRKGTDSTTSGVDNIAFDEVKEENKDNGATSGQ